MMPERKLYVQFLFQIPDIDLRNDAIRNRPQNGWNVRMAGMEQGTVGPVNAPRLLHGQCLKSLAAS